MTDGRANHYRAYLLRLWRDDETTPWRASLKDARRAAPDEQTVTFSSVEQLLAFLKKQTILVEEE
jgi:hypothetical protein